MLFKKGVMRKLLFELTVISISSLLLTSCGSSNDSLSHFSKRKFFKKYKLPQE